MDIELNQETAAQLRRAENSTNNIQVINGSGYYGMYQIGVTYKEHKHPEWTAWGGKQEEVGNASPERQLEVARVGWKRKAKASGATTNAQIYAAWNLGEGHVARLRKGGDQPFMSLPASTIQAVKNQCWGKGLGSDFTCQQVLDRVEQYWDKGRVPSVTGAPNDLTGKPDWVAPGVDVNDGEGKEGRGGFGGKIRLFLSSATMNPTDMVWTTVNTKAPSHMFLVPATLGYSEPDVFINEHGEAARIETDYSCGLPHCKVGNIDGYFVPLAMTNPTEGIA